MKISESNFQIFAAKNYDNPICFNTEEFYDDLKRFKYLKRLLIKYKDSGEFRERLILNHITTIFNVFGTRAGIRMIFFKLDGFYPQLKSIFRWMGILPTTIEELGEESITIFTDPIPYDENINDILKRIK